MIHDDRAEVLADLAALTRDLKFARQLPNNYDAVARLERMEADLLRKLHGLDRDAGTEQFYLLRCAIMHNGATLRTLLVDALEGAFVTAQEHADLKAGVKLLADFRGASE